VATRRGWDALSAEYRARLERGGITRESYGAGESLRTARGHSPAYPAPTERAEIAGRLASGDITAADQRRINAWQQSRAYPAWAEKTLPNQPNVALTIIASGAGHPNTWEQIEVTVPRRGETGPIVYTITKDDGSVIDVVLPEDVGRQAAIAMAADITAEFDLMDIEVTSGGASTEDEDEEDEDAA
jgi:hypothetical protein